MHGGFLMPEEQAQAERDGLLARHIAQLAEAEDLIMDALHSGDAEKAKTAKLVMDALRSKQEAERRAHGIDALGGGEGAPEIINIVWKA